MQSTWPKSHNHLYFHISIILQSWRVCACACVCTHVCTSTDEGRDRRSALCILLRRCLPSFWRDRLPLSWISPCRLSWLTSKSQASYCFCLPSAGVTSLHHHSQILLYACWRSNSGSSLLLHGKYFINWDFTPTPATGVLKKSIAWSSAAVGPHQVSQICLSFFFHFPISYVSIRCQ